MATPKKMSTRESINKEADDDGDVKGVSFDDPTCATLGKPTCAGLDEVR
jgi:hypothetical protein